MDGLLAGSGGTPPRAFKLARIGQLDDLEGGTYWPQLRPHFLKPEYRHLRYSIQERSREIQPAPGPVSLRGASGAGELDVAFIADRLRANLTITGSGLPDYCLTIVSRGGLICTGASRSALEVDERVGLIYRGRPGTTLAAAGDHERLALWIPEASLKQRLAALLGGPVTGDVIFSPVFDWEAPAVQSLRHLIRLLVDELGSPASSFLGSEPASRSFTDLLIYTLLRSVPHSHSEQLERPGSFALPGTLRRAEAYIRAHVEEPIALHEVAAAAGCSVRSLQLSFRHHRETTPLLAIRQARLEAARTALCSGEAGATITEVAHRFGFANPGRFTRLYRAAFGEAPAEVLRRGGKRA
jgi:AraC-like DNA-binding protein